MQSNAVLPAEFLEGVWQVQTVRGGRVENQDLVEVRQLIERIAFQQKKELGRHRKLFVGVDVYISSLIWWDFLLNQYVSIHTVLTLTSQKLLSYVFFVDLLQQPYECPYQR